MAKLVATLDGLTFADGDRPHHHVAVLRFPAIAVVKHNSVSTVASLQI